MYPRNSLIAMPEDLIGTGPLEPTNEGYALAKLVGTKSVSITASELGLNWRTLVLSNLYGPGDHFGADRSHLVAAIINKVAEAKKSNSKFINMWGDGSARREFTYVDDVATFIVANLEKDKVKVSSNKEIIALIAYLQRLGTDIKLNTKDKASN